MESSGLDLGDISILSSELFPYGTSPKGKINTIYFFILILQLHFILHYLGRCMTFWYYLAGVSPGYLTILVKDLITNNTYMTWRLGGSNFGDQWNYGTFGFYISSQYKIWIEGSRGASRSFMAVDDIIFKESFYCNVQPAAASLGDVLTTPQVFTTIPTVPATPSVYDCNFENGFCNWKQPSGFNLQWLRQQGTTPSALTGPLVDHT